MGIKLKSLRPAVGTYGTVAAGGIIEVDAARAEELIKTRRFVKATADDVKAAQARQDEMLAAIPGTTVWAQVLAPSATESPDKPKRGKGAAKAVPGDDPPEGKAPATAAAGDPSDHAV